MVWRSCAVTTPCCTALMVSVCWVVIEDACPLTVTVCCTAAGCSVTAIWRVELTAIATSERASGQILARSR